VTQYGKLLYIRSASISYDTDHEFEIKQNDDINQYFSKQTPYEFVILRNAEFQRNFNKKIDIVFEGCLLDVDIAIRFAFFFSAVVMLCCITAHLHYLGY